MYSLILVSRTYVAAFLLIFSVAWLCGFTLVLPLVLPERLKAVVPTMTIVFVLAFLPGLARDVWDCLPPGVAGEETEPPSYHDLRVAQELRERGLEPGTRVALWGDPMRFEHFYWARLCGVHIVAELAHAPMPAVHDLVRFQRFLDAVRQAGAEYVVLSPKQVHATGYGGIPIDNGDIRLIDLRK